MVKVSLFCWWCCVCCIVVLLTLCIIILRARHDHNKIAPCGMIKVFLIEFESDNEIYIIQNTNNNDLQSMFFFF